MRWEALFDDLEAQLDAAEAAEVAGEVAERSRGEAQVLRLVDRIGPGVGHPLRVGLVGGGVLDGRLAGAGPDWLLLDAPGGEALVPLPALAWLSGIGALSAQPGRDGVVAARLDLRYALRGLVRDRSTLEVRLLDGAVLHGTADRVGVDFLELAEHPVGEPRRAHAVRRVRLVRLAALAVVRRLP